MKRSSVKEVARQLGKEPRILKKLEDLASLDRGSVVCIDLEGLTQEECKSIQFGAFKQTCEGLSLIGCYSHLHQEREEIGIQLGCQEVIPNSVFFKNLTKIVSEYSCNNDKNATNREAENGASRLTLLVFSTIFAAVFYSAYCIIPFFYCYYELKNQMSSVIDIASTESDEVIRKRLEYHIKKLEIPCEPSDLMIQREDHYMRIRLPYREVFYVSFQGKDYDLWAFDFVAEAAGEF